MWFDELVRLIYIVVIWFGVISVWFIGGELLLVYYFDEVVVVIVRLWLCLEILLIINGVGLVWWVGVLVEVGLDWVNVLLDSIDCVYFVVIICWDWFVYVLVGLVVVKVVGLIFVKVNVVFDFMIGCEDVVDLLRFCLECGY